MMAKRQRWRLVLGLVLGVLVGCRDQQDGENAVFDLGPMDWGLIFDCNVEYPTQVEYQNYSVDAADIHAPFNPDRPTIAFIHGFNRNKNGGVCGAYVWPANMAKAFQPLVGENANLMVLDYDAVSGLKDEAALAEYAVLGADFATYLRDTGLDDSLQIISHSSGSDLVFEIVKHLDYVEQITFLDFSPVTRDAILGNWDWFSKRVGYVVNYWVSTPFGLGGDLPPGPTVTNICMLSLFDGADFTAAHFVPVLWYLDAIEYPETLGGPDWSFVTGEWTYAGVDMIELNNFMFARPADGSMSNWSDDWNFTVIGLRNDVANGVLRHDTVERVAASYGLTYLGP